ncbi:MAG: CPBP family intramembrane metalloprotease [Microlunatus sp.]
MTTTLIPTTAPPAFHQLARPTRWWRPLLVLLTAVLFYVAMAIVPMLALVILADVHPSSRAGQALANLESFNAPVGLAAGLVSVALMWPATALAVRLVGQRSARTLLSIAGRLRWRLIARASVITAVVFVVFGAVLWLVGPSTETTSNGAGTDGSFGRMALMLGIVLLVVPWQAAAEEVVFRGLFTQTVGSWLRHPAWAILLPVPLFVFAHGYSLAGLIEVGVFAIVAGYLTWRTGGLEAAIGMHVVNNLGAFAIAILTGADLEATEVEPLAALISIAYTLVTAALILAGTRRRDGRSYREVGPFGAPNGNNSSRAGLRHHSTMPTRTAT